MFEIDPEIIIPEKCQGCGVQCEIGDELISLLLLQQVGEQIGENLVGEPGESFDEMIEENVPSDIADEVKQGVRKMIGNDLAEIDEDIKRAQDEIESNALACSGVLKIRATKRDVTYTVNVCTSPRVYVRDSEQLEHLPTHIRADSSHKQN